MLLALAIGKFKSRSDQHGERWQRATTSTRGLALCFLSCCCSLAVGAMPEVRFSLQDSGSPESFRAVQAVSEQVAWVSGTNGTVLRTDDGGETWRNVSVPHGQGLDFRNLAAIDGESAIVISAGTPALVFTTDDAGETWKLRYENHHPHVFVDSLCLHDAPRGLAFGDPIDGQLFLISTEDAGRSWQRRTGTPKIPDGIAGFAASNSSLIAVGTKLVLGLGGRETEASSSEEPTAWVLTSVDDGKSWVRRSTPMSAGRTRGIFSMAAISKTHLVAVGGDYAYPEQREGNCLISLDGGTTWRAPKESSPAGYRSSVAVATVGDHNILVATGTTGVDISKNGGESWEPATATANPLHAVTFAPKSHLGWAVGAEGQIARVSMVTAGNAANEKTAAASGDGVSETIETKPTAVGSRLPRKGDEIMVCGQLFHTATPVVLWTDPGGYDAYRVERRFAPLKESSWERSRERVEGLNGPSRYNLRRAGLTDEQIERVRGGGWDLETLQDRVDQFVIHYDVCGTSQTCFKVLHDMRGLSVHFLLDIDGTIYQTLDLKERAWHATKSNSRSVGIEIANIGAYPPDDLRALNQWYQKQADGTVEIRLPERMGDGGVRTPDFVGRPTRPQPISGVVQGTKLVQYDLTEEQYRALGKLTATLCHVLPKIRCDYPQDADGKLIPHQLTGDQWESFSGVLGHFHVQANKIDPGPAFQWDRVIRDAREYLDR